MPNNNTHVNGNAEAIAVLEQFLNIAKNDVIGYVAIVACKEPNQYINGYSGTVELENIAKEGIVNVKERMDASILNRTMPEADPDLDASYVAYNVTQSPVSYDFCTWLINREMDRIKAGAPAPLKVAFWFGRDGKTGLTADHSNRHQMLDYVCRPLLGLIGAVEDPKATKGYSKDFFSSKYICDLYKEGIAVPKLVSNTEVPYAKDSYVTITLREASYWPHRNSKLKEWLRFADYLKKQGLDVVIVRDTAMADVSIPKYTVDSIAAKDLDYRTALYQNAKCNCFVSNGPAAIALYGDKPFLTFIETDDQGAYNASTSAFWENCVGVKVGDQYPWSSPQQKLIWKADFFTNIAVAWDELWSETKELKENND